MIRSASEPWKFSAVERKIMRCVAAGEDAVFAREPTGERPVVSGSFLSDLWLERIPGAHVHTMGLSIEGLMVEGDIRLYGAQISERGRDGLVGLNATDCHFAGEVSLDNSRIETIWFDKCTFLVPPEDQDGSAKADAPGTALRLNHAQVRGSVGLSHCTVAGQIDAEGADIEGAFVLFETRVTGQVSIESGTVGRQLSILKCDIGSRTTDLALQMSSARIGGGLMMFSVHLRGSMFASSIEVKEVSIVRARIGRNANHGLFAPWAKVHGSWSVGQLKSPGKLTIVNGEVGGDLNLHRCTLSQFIRIENNRIAGNLGIGETKASSPSSETLGLSCRFNSATNLAISKTKVVGSVSLDRVTMRGGLEIGECRFGRRRRDVSALRDENHSFTAVGIQCGGITVGGTIFNCQTSFHEARCESSVVFERCFFNGKSEANSLNLTNSRVGNLLVFRSCLFASSIDMPLVTATEVQFEGVIVHSGGHVQSLEGHALWASDCTVSRRFSIGDRARVDTRRMQSVFNGRIILGSTTIGENFNLSATRLYHVAGKDSEANASVLDLSSTKIGGHVTIGQGSDRIDPEGAEVFVEGCIDLDDARIEGHFYIERVKQVAIGAIARPQGRLDSERRVSTRKRGVALSLSRARIAGDFILQKPDLDGLVDLRHAHIERIADGGGKRWELAGIRPGHLLLDDLTYRDLVDVQDDEPEGATRGGPTDAVTLRLAWLALQYPGRKPTAEIFVPQPYEQLARIFGAEGNERARRKVQIARRDLQRQHGGLKLFERTVQLFLKLVSEYGYDPGRAIIATLLFLAAGTAIATGMDSVGALMPANDGIAKDYPFNALVYALDAAIPIIDLDQDAVWTVNPDAFVYPWTAQAMVIAKGIYEIVGMLLVSVTVLTLTGTLREKD